jgi:hypothetical protein
MQIGPNGGFDVSDREKLFTLNGMTLFFAPFAVHADCLGFRATRRFTEIGVSLGHVVTFPGVLDNPLGDGRFNVRIPKGDVLISMAMIDNRSPESAVAHPNEDVTGVIDLTRGTVQLHVVVGDLLHFRVPAGCGGVDRVPCIINQFKPGVLTADIAGIIVFPQPVVTTGR